MASTYRVALVTAVYDVYGIRRPYIGTLWTNCLLLAAACPPDTLLYIWHNEPEPPAAFCAYSTVRMIRADLNTFPSFAAGMTPGLQLPAVRSLIKDTDMYLALINAKVDMVARVAALHDAQSVDVDPVPFFAWIDAGIIKIWDGRIDEFQKGLYAATRTVVPSATFVAPGIWPFMADVCVDHVHWHFMGGFFMIAADSVQFICDCIRARYMALVQTGYTTWEVNVWALLEADMRRCLPAPPPFAIIWKKGNFDQTFFNAF